MADNNNRQAWLGPQFLQKLANANLAGWQAVNEIIANSIDSWIDFNNPRPVLEINIEVEQSNNLSASSITISDNAQGMDFSALEKLFWDF